MKPLARATPAALVLLGACGGGTLTSEDVPPGVAVAVGVIIVVAVLYVAYVGTKRGD